MNKRIRNKNTKKSLRRLKEAWLKYLNTTEIKWIESKAINLNMTVELKSTINDSQLRKMGKMPSGSDVYLGDTKIGTIK